MFAPKAMIVRSNELVLHESKTVTERGSKFTGYITEIQSLNDVKAAYYKIRRMHGRANHIICSYRLTECVGPFNQDAIDDGEHGASRNMLDYMKKQELCNTALFVVQYFGGAKLGPTRFQCIMEVAKDAHHEMINHSFEQLAPGDQEIEAGS